jgi:hypothetical protein
LRARGVTHAALFGSRARGDAREDSDTDIMIEIDPEARIGVWDYVGIKGFYRGVVRWSGRSSEAQDTETLCPLICDIRCDLCLLKRRRLSGGSATFCRTLRWPPLEAIVESELAIFGDP